MKRGRLPLTALRSFEAAGRHLSFTRAADELAVSQAAVSRQIRELERIVGHALFERRVRAVDLTDPGRALLATVSRAFDDIDAAIERGRASPETPSLRISCEPSFAACWLIPHLDAFSALHPEIAVTVDASSRLSDLRRDGVDVAIRCSATDSRWPGTEARPLAACDMLAVAAPALATGPDAPRRPEDLAGLRLIHEDSRQVWRDWFAAAGLAATQAMPGPVLADGGLVLQAALRGQGFALIDRLFAAEALAAGRLVALPGPTFRWGAYHLVVQRFDRLPEAAQRFVAWIEAALPAPAG